MSLKVAGAVWALLRDRPGHALALGQGFGHTAGMHAPAISVLIIVYNWASTIGAAARSVLTQTFTGVRPCVFINAHDVSWEDDPDDAFWRLGEVVSADAVVPALTAALAAPYRFADAQRGNVADTFGTLQGSAERATEVILVSFEESR